MGISELEAAEVVILDEFVERLFALLLDHHQARVVEMDLTLVQAQALKLLRTAPLPTSRIASALGISAPAVTQLTDRLARKQLIERRTVKNDRRAVIVAVTEKGGRLIDGFRKRRNETFADALSRLGAEDRGQVVEALRKIAAVLGVDDRSQRLGLRPTTFGESKVEGQTKIEQPYASKERGQVPVSLPTRRMRIEWD